MTSRRSEAVSGEVSGSETVCPRTRSCATSRLEAAVVLADSRAVFKGKPSREKLLDRSLKLMRKGRYRESELVLREALRRFPADPEVMLRLAATLLETAPGEAGEHVKRAVWLDPEDPYKLTRAGSLLFFLGEMEAARDCLRRAQSLAPPDFVFAADLKHLAGKLAIFDADYLAAEALLRAAFEEQPREVGHGEALARLLIDLGRPVEAVEVADAVLRHRPDDRKWPTSEAQRRTWPVVRRRIMAGTEIAIGDPGYIPLSGRPVGS